MAIIAVLVAIAVPLFVGQLGNAEESVKNANIHSVRSTAVAAILSDSKFMKTTNSKDAKSWTVNATVSKSGEMSLVSIVPAESDTKGGVDSCTKLTTANKESTYSKGTVGDYFVIVYINLVDLTTVSNSAVS